MFFILRKETNSLSAIWLRRWCSAIHQLLWKDYSLPEEPHTEPRNCEPGGAANCTFASSGRLLLQLHNRYINCCWCARVEYQDAHQMRSCRSCPFARRYDWQHRYSCQFDRRQRNFGARSSWFLCLYDLLLSRHYKYHSTLEVTIQLVVGQDYLGV